MSSPNPSLAAPFSPWRRHTLLPPPHRLLRHLRRRLGLLRCLPCGFCTLDTTNDPYADLLPRHRRCSSGEKNSNLEDPPWATARAFSSVQTPATLSSDNSLDGRRSGGVKSGVPLPTIISDCPF
ncbi:hypothetical protein TIFTF001_016927 [Ficus carica]|uniref:Uncharacterized protein n=1 Tax=Ficus carica TaxID=3494 RepID=A0AA88A409_FICCA|nr:hypothetical protein TIFTF001_016927 [Ficus carica]